MSTWCFKIRDIQTAKTSKNKLIKYNEVLKILTPKPMLKQVKFLK